MSAPSPLHRHQSSLEGVIDFSAEAPLGTNQRSNAKPRFYRIVEHFGASSAIDNSVPPLYELPRLVRCTYEYALSDEFRDNFLRAFFQATALSLTGQGDNNDGDLDNLEDSRSLFFGFASYLLDHSFLPIAHILPHSLIKANMGYKLLNNAITLTSFIYIAFNNFKIFFEPIPNQQPYTYRIKTFYHCCLIRNLAFPIIRTFYLTDNRLIDPPLPRLLAVHRAIAHILRLSRAGEYIDKLLQDMDKQGIQADGSTELDKLVKLG
ncbi:hypothetical protein F5B22DRAFT_634978 [Xylaria bambusicola]|uniref:uncharacterized protein n=1 Tax=Xylaria bambusicola TaxID=326684 RepID=UPI002008C454|nr:uncharacterized protein F5B22DRAFT_634978 [Xylaria bambusicola]KAI0520691.1 hypothetical protein F5B22DRAFT_634978 [Xylaria bambusicola]